MKISRISILDGAKHFSGFTSDRKFPPYLKLTLNLLEIELLPDTKFSGTVDFIHLLPGSTKRTRRFWFNQNNFNKKLSLSYNIYTGDLLDRIRICLYDMPAGLLEKQLCNIEPQYINTLHLDLFKPELQLEFLEALRTLSPVNFPQWFYQELPALEAASILGSTEHFKKWAVSDKIVRLYGRGEISPWYLDWAVQHLSNEYDDIKKLLGIEEIVV